MRITAIWKNQLSTAFHLAPHVRHPHLLNLHRPVHVPHPHHPNLHPPAHVHHPHLRIFHQPRNKIAVIFAVKGNVQNSVQKSQKPRLSGRFLTGQSRSELTSTQKHSPLAGVHTAPSRRHIGTRPRNTLHSIFCPLGSNSLNGMACKFP
jgi:hypothetical protein